MNLSLNAVVFEGICRVYRNSVVRHIRTCLAKEYGDDWVLQIRRPFQKEWEEIKTNAELRRQTGELETRLTDDLDILGVNHFSNLFDAYFPALFPETENEPDIVRRQRKRAILGWAQHIKNIRDPALGHPGDEDIAPQDAFVTLDAARRICQSFDEDAFQSIWALQHSIYGGNNYSDVAPDVAEQCYIECLSETYMAFFQDRFVHQLMETTSEQTGDNTNNPVIDRLMVDLVALVNEDSSTSSPSSLDRQAWPEETQTVPVFDLHEALSDYRHIALIGEAGSGKTSALLWLMGAYREGIKPNRLPIFVSLNRYDSGNVEEFLSREWAASVADVLRADTTQRTALNECILPLVDNLENYIANGRILLLLDGLNEMPRGDDYQERSLRLRRFIEKVCAQGNWVLVACRPQDYGDMLRNLQRVEVRPLDDGRILEFLQSYLGDIAGETLWTRLNESRYSSVKDLIRNPFLLVALIAVVGGLEGGALPTARTALLGRMATGSIRREAAKGLPNRIEQSQQEKTLAAIAATMTLSVRTSVNKDELARHLPESWFVNSEFLMLPIDAVLRTAMNERLLRWSPGNQGGMVSFEHQLWQSYFTAKLIAGLGDIEWLTIARQICGDQNLNTRFDFVYPHLHDPFWKDAIVFTATMLDKADATQYVNDIVNSNSLWEEYLYRDIILATDCLIEGSDVAADTVDRILGSLEQAEHAGIRPLFERASRARMYALKTLRRTEEIFASAIGSEYDWQARQIAAEILEGMGQDAQADDARVIMVQDQEISERVRRDIAKELEVRGKNLAAIEAWTWLENDSTTGRGTRREARAALRRLR